MGGFPNEVLEALWALVWSGEATNDTLAPLRARLHGTRETTKRAQRRGIVVPRSRLGTLPGSEGRWTLRGARGARVPTDTERRTALARSLLDRYGVLTREAVHAEGIETGFTSVYDVLKAMEEAGKVRRGYFIAGHGATQFAQPGADERLRAMRESSNGVEGQEAKTHVLAATDPANAYGATLPWPEREDAHPQRSAGASVILHDGALIGWLGRSEHALLVYAPAEDPQRSLVLHALANALASMVEDGRRKLLLVATVDGEPVERSPLAPYLREAGFLPGARGWLRRKTRLAANGAVSYGDGGVMA